MTANIQFAHHPASSTVGIPATSDPSVSFWLWSWRPEILLLCVVAGGLYVLGWWRLSCRTQRRLPSWRPAFAVVGLTTLSLALLSPLDALSEALFSAHMLQHMLLLSAAPALLLADPLPLMLWALPRAVRLHVGRLLAPGMVVRQIWRGLTWMPSAWLIYAGTLWLWHLPIAYEGALRSTLLHDLEHLAFFWASVVFWWPIINPAPHLRRHAHHVLRIIYLLLAAFQKAGLALLLVLSSRIFYPFYAGMPRLLDLDPLEDQMWGGIIMWGMGGVVDMVAVLVVLFHFFTLETRLREHAVPAEVDGPGK